LRALAPDPAARPTADDLAQALDAFLARRPTRWDLQRPGRRLTLFYQRHRVFLNLSLAGVVLAVSLGLGLLTTVVAKSGLEVRARNLSRHVAALDDDVLRLTGQKGTLETELARLRTEREAVAGAEAREREARLLAEKRASEADVQLTAATQLARETAGKLERAQATVAQLEASLADTKERVRSLERDVSARDADLRASAERYRTSVDALRQHWDGEGARLRQDLARERETSAILQRRLAEAERERNSAVQARTETRASLEGKLEVCRADRDDLRGQLDATHSEAGRPKKQAPQATTR
jgi:chromosome segregation ATPase